MIDATKDRSYYAKDGMVWKYPETTHHPNGSMTISIGFPICKMDEIVGPAAAETVVALMNADHQASGPPK